jgi:hypothetical protein
MQRGGGGVGRRDGALLRAAALGGEHAGEARNQARGLHLRHDLRVREAKEMASTTRRLGGRFRRQWRDSMGSGVWRKAGVRCSGFRLYA